MILVCFIIKLTSDLPQTRGSIKQLTRVSCIPIFGINTPLDMAQLVLLVCCGRIRNLDGGATVLLKTNPDPMEPGGTFTGQSEPSRLIRTAK